MTIFQVIAALVMPALAHRSHDRRPLLMISLAAQLAGYAGLVLWPLGAPHLWVALIGFGLGACFALSLILTLDHCRKPHEAGQLGGFVQGVGFLINALSPWMTGWLRELTGDGGIFNDAADTAFQAGQHQPNGVCCAANPPTTDVRL
jgi:CP family cyanate transporter-like MFS transporter